MVRKPAQKLAPSPVYRIYNGESFRLPWSVGITLTMTARENCGRARDGRFPRVPGETPAPPALLMSALERKRACRSLPARSSP